MTCVTMLLLAGLPLFAADQVVLTNDDTITGTIVKKDGGKLTIKNEFMGEVTMPWTAVKTIRSDSEVFVQLPAGEIVRGKLTTTGNQLEVATPSGTKAAPLAQVTAVRDAAAQRSYERLLHPRLIDLWYGNFDIGLALARGNSRTDTFTTAFRAARETRTDKTSLYFNQTRGNARANNVNNTIASAIRGGWKYDRSVTPRFFLTAFNDYEHDRFQNLDLRFVVGAGAGYNAVKRENLKLDVDGGANFNRENFLDGLDRNFAELNFGDNLAYKMAGATSITQAFRMFNNLTNTGQYRINFDLSVVTAVRKWLGFHVTASDRYLSNPVQGRQRNDVLLSTGFRLSFAK
jgi:Protein of unknown function, DUF481